MHDERLKKSIHNASLAHEEVPPSVLHLPDWGSTRHRPLPKPKPFFQSPAPGPASSLPGLESRYWACVRTCVHASASLAKARPPNPHHPSHCTSERRPPGSSRWAVFQHVLGMSQGTGRSTRQAPMSGRPMLPCSLGSVPRRQSLHGDCQMTGVGVRTVVIVMKMKAVVNKVSTCNNYLGT